MCIRDRTSSAPPNFDSLNTNKLLTPPIPKQQLQRKDDVFVSACVIQGNAPETHHSIPKPKKDNQIYSLFIIRLGNSKFPCILDISGK